MAGIPLEAPCTQYHPFIRLPRCPAAPLPVFLCVAHNCAHVRSTHPDVNASLPVSSGLSSCALLRSKAACQHQARHCFCCREKVVARGALLADAYNPQVRISMKRNRPIPCRLTAIVSISETSRGNSLRGLTNAQSVFAALAITTAIHSALDIASTEDAPDFAHF
jgi:hypothetical protein